MRKICTLCFSPFIIGSVTFSRMSLLYIRIMRPLSTGILSLVSILSMLGGLSILVSTPLSLSTNLVLRTRWLMPSAALVTSSRQCGVEVLSFDKLKGTYTSCPDFSLIYLNLLAGNRNHHVDFVIHDGFLFKRSKLCIPKTSFRYFLVWEMHAVGLAGHLGKDRTIALVADRFYWPSLKRDVHRIVSQCLTASPVS